MAQVRANGLTLEVERHGDPCDWDVTLRLLITDFESVTLTDTLTLPD
jgi:hypothetical protein